MPLDGTLYEDETLRVLRDAQERICDPEHWCQGEYSNGPSKRWDDPGSTAWCVEGTVRLEVSNLSGSAWDLLGLAAQDVAHTGAVSLNDNTDHPTVMKMFDRAQELRRAEIMETIEAV